MHLCTLDYGLHERATPTTNQLAKYQGILVEDSVSYTTYIIFAQKLRTHPLFWVATTTLTDIYSPRRAKGLFVPIGKFLNLILQALNHNLRTQYKCFTYIEPQNAAFTNGKSPERRRNIANNAVQHRCMSPDNKFDMKQAIFFKLQRLQEQTYDSIYRTFSTYSRELNVIFENDAPRNSTRNSTINNAEAFRLHSAEFRFQMSNSLQFPRHSALNQTHPNPPHSSTFAAIFFFLLKFSHKEINGNLLNKRKFSFT